MKKYIVMALCLAMSATMFAQETEAQKELKAEVNKGVVKFQSEDGDYSFRVGGRVVLDGSHYVGGFTDRGSGAAMTSARLRIISKMGDKVDFKLDADFMSSTFIKDAYLRYHTSENGFVRFGNITEPFSAENIISTFDEPFIAKSATMQAFGTGRAIGATYRHYHDYFWFEGGLFSEKIHARKAGDMGWAATARLLGRIQGDDYHFHLGGAVTTRRPDANGYADGSDDYNRTVTFSSNLESAIDNTHFLSATANNAKNIFKYNIEAMGHYKNFYAKVEYTGVNVARERNWEALCQSYAGSLMGLYMPTPAAAKAFLGDDLQYKFGGYTAEVGMLVKGGDYKYNAVEALMRRPGAGSLEILARYNHTDLNTIKEGSIFHNNGYTGAGFYSNAMMIAFYMKNDSVAGGSADTFTLGANYFFTDQIVLRVNYNLAYYNNPYNLNYCYDNVMHAVQVRLGFEF